MIEVTYTKALALKIYCKKAADADDSRKVTKDMRLAFVPFCKRACLNMSVQLPDGELYFFNAESMKSACEKVINIGGL